MLRLFSFTFLCGLLLGTFVCKDLHAAEAETPPSIANLGDDDLDKSAKVDFVCQRGTLHIEDQGRELGDSQECDAEFNVLIKKNHREIFAASVSYLNANRDQYIHDEFGLSEQAMKAVIRARVLSWLKTTLLYYRDEAPGDDDPFELTAAYLNSFSNSRFPVDLTYGHEEDNNSKLDILYAKKTFGARNAPTNLTTYGGGVIYDQEFRDGTERTDNRYFAAAQLNLNQIDQSIIVGGGKEDGGPSSMLFGLHGSLLGKKTNEWMTICRVRRSRNSVNEIRKTEFCLVSISIGDENLARGRYIDLLGTFVPGMVKPTRIVNGSTLTENPTRATTQSHLNRPKWEFVATSTNVQVTESEELVIRSASLTRSFDGKYYAFTKPFVGISYDENNFLYFDQDNYVLRADDPRKVVSVNVGFGLGEGEDPDNLWVVEGSFGANMNTGTPVVQVTLSKRFGKKGARAQSKPVANHEPESQPNPFSKRLF